MKAAEEAALEAADAEPQPKRRRLTSKRTTADIVNSLPTADAEDDVAEDESEEEEGGEKDEEVAPSELGEDGAAVDAAEQKDGEAETKMDTSCEADAD